MKTINRPFKKMLMGLGLIGLAIAVVGCGTEEADTNYEAASSGKRRTSQRTCSSGPCGPVGFRAVRRILMAKVAPTMSPNLHAEPNGVGFEPHRIRRRCL